MAENNYKIQIADIVKKYELSSQVKVCAENVMKYLADSESVTLKGNTLMKTFGEAFVKETSAKLGNVIDEERVKDFVNTLDKDKSDREIEIYNLLKKNKVGYNEMNEYYKKGYISFKIYSNYILDHVSNPIYIADGIYFASSELDDSTLEKLLDKLLKVTNNVDLIREVGTYRPIRENFKFQQKIVRKFVELKERDELLDYGIYLAKEAEVKPSQKEAINDIILKGLCKLDGKNKYHEVIKYIEYVRKTGVKNFKAFEDALTKKGKIDLVLMQYLTLKNDSLNMDYSAINYAFLTKGKILDVVLFANKVGIAHTNNWLYSLTLKLREKNEENLYKMYRGLSYWGKVDTDDFYTLGSLLGASDEISDLIQMEYDNKDNMPGNMKAHEFISMLGEYDTEDKFTSRLVKEYLLEEGQVFMDEDPKIRKNTKNQH